MWTQSGCCPGNGEAAAALSVPRIRSEWHPNSCTGGGNRPHRRGLRVDAIFKYDGGGSASRCYDVCLSGLQDGRAGRLASSSSATWVVSALEMQRRGQRVWLALLAWPCCRKCSSNSGMDQVGARIHRRDDGFSARSNGYHVKSSVSYIHGSHSSILAVLLSTERAPTSIEQQEEKQLWR
jgi:hypothetical protein